jgi:hypothetical protein
MLKMIKKTPIMPSSLLVEGIDAKVDYDYIGSGGFGCVFKAEIEGNPVALKLLYKSRNNDASRSLILNGYYVSIVDRDLIGFLSRSVDVAISKSRARPTVSRNL